MPWLTRGLREGVVTTRYPHRPDAYGDRFHGAVRVGAPPADGPAAGALDEVATICPTAAISVERRAGASPSVRLDRGRCILCGRCVRSLPDVFSMGPEIETASLSRRLLVVPPDAGDEAALGHLRADIAGRTRSLRRSVHVRHLDCGSDGAEEWEIAALTNPVYDIQRLGVFFTASPRHADLLLVTGAGSSGMVEPLRLTYESMPRPKVVVAVGTDAVSGGMFGGSYATHSGVGSLIGVDVFVPGSPPSPFSILHGILLAIGLLPAPTGRGAGAR
jgi:Ni,Fe-hydrogenase III small subunit/ferredoxin